MNAKTYALDDVIVVVMRGGGFTALEQTIMDSGEPQRVVEPREDFQRMMAARYRTTIEELTGRTVVAFLSQAHIEPDITMEVFFIDRPLEGFGAVELSPRRWCERRGADLSLDAERSRVLRRPGGRDVTGMPQRHAGPPCAPPSRSGAHAAELRG
jgi:uncharacterized protein YbcI